MARDDEVLDLGRPLVDAQGANGPVQPVHGALGQDAPAAKDLHRIVHDPLRRLRGEGLRHRGLERDPLRAHVLLPGRPVREKAGGVQRDRHPAQLLLDELEVAERLPELAALRRVPERLGERARSHAARRGGDGRPEPVQRHHPELEAPALRAHPLLRRDGALLESDLAEGVGLAQHLRPDEAEPFGAGRHEEAGDPAAPGGRIRGREHRIDVGDAGVGDERLAPVQNVFVASPLGARGQRGRVAAGLRLGHRERADRAPVQDAGEPPGRELGPVSRIVLQLGRQQERCPSERLEGEDGVRERRGGGQRLPDQAAGAEVRLSDRDQPSAGAEQARQPPRFLAGLRVVGRLRPRRDLAGREGADPLRQLEVVVLQEGADRTGAPFRRTSHRASP